MSAHSSKLTTFPIGGVHPYEHKEMTQHLPIEVMPCPSEVNIFVKQHVGQVCEVTVAPKDKVIYGQVIGTVGDKLGVSIHASVSGTVKAIKECAHSVIARDTAIVIAANKTTDAVDSAKQEISPEDWRKFSREEILKRMKEGGLVGLGGAGFPIYAKANLKAGVKVDTLILNGAECEPYITCDHRVMLEYAADIIEGAKILMTIIGNKKCVIGVEANKADAVQALNQAIDKAGDKSDWDISVMVLQVKYPQGAADQIMESITGRVRPAGVRSSTIGIIVQNVYSTKTIYDAVALNRPFTERVITVTGNGITRPANLQVRIGTTVGEIAEYLGGTKEALKKIVVGGPMMGSAISSMDVAITKATPGIIFLSDEEVAVDSYGPCISCGFCIDACPMGLEPHNISKYVEAGRGLETEKFGIEDECFECGSCAFSCPANRPLVQFIKIAKAQIEKSKRK